MNPQQLTIEDAIAITDDYLAYGIEYVDKISKTSPGGMNIEAIKLAASWLQADSTFTDWAFIEIFGASNKLLETMGL